MRHLIVVLLLLAAAAVGTGGCAQVCPGALLTGVLADQGGELVVVPDGGGQPEHVVWPPGHAVGRDADLLVLTNMFGQVVARQADRVSLGGGERESGTWIACGGFDVEGQQQPTSFERLVRAAIRS